MQPGLGRQAEGSGSAVADEEKAVTAAIPSIAAEIIVELGLRGLRFDLDPGGFADGWLAKDQIYIWLCPSTLLRCHPPRAKIRSTKVSKSRQSSWRIIRSPIVRS